MVFAPYSGPYNIFLGLIFVALFVTAWIIGGVFLTLWAVKSLDARTLRRWGIILFVVGLIGLIMAMIAYGHMSHSWKMMQAAQLQLLLLR